MFFKKKPLTPQTETPLAEPEEKGIPSFTADAKPLSTPDTDPRPVYIVGANALAVFLAARLQEAGCRTIIISDPKTNTDLSTNGVTVKEDYSLKKIRYRFETSFWLKYEPRLIILAETAPRIKSAATVISPHKLGTAPILCFSLLKDSSWLRAIFGNNIINGYFEGWTTSSEQQVAVLGRAPSLLLSCGEYNTLPEVEALQKFLNRASLNCRIAEDDNTAFWNHFAVYATGSLLTAVHGQNIFDLLKNRTLREKIRPLLEETVALAAAEKVTLNADNLLKILYNIPNNYIFPLQESFRSGSHGELPYFGAVISDAARFSGCRVPGLNELLKQLYNRSLDAIA